MSEASTLVSPAQRDLFAAESWLPVGFKLTALSEEELRVYEALYFHQGADAAVPIPVLAYEAFPFRTAPSRERLVREVVKSLTEGHGVAIATSIRKPFGAYLITDPEELLQYTGNLTSRAVSMLRRAAVLKKVSLPAFLGQLSMEVEQ